MTRGFLFFTATLSALSAWALPSRAMAQQVGYVNFITAGFVDPAGILPAINGVPNAGVNNLAVAIPKSVLLQGDTYTYTMSSQNFSYNGKCEDSFELTQLQGGRKVVIDSGVISKYKCAAGQLFEWAINGHVIPNSPGPAVLTGTVKFGATKIKTVLQVLLQ